MVFGEGNTNSSVVFVGEGPGYYEDQSGRPFVGRSGALLTNAIERCIGLRRDEVFICNVVKCRPPDNKTPDPNEIASCLPYLHRQLEIINPSIIVTLGNTPKTALTGLSQHGITKIRGDWLKWRDIPLMPTFHPAYLLRNPSAVELFEDDLRKVMERLRVICE